MTERARRSPSSLLPDELPVFPLSGALLLPGGRLPLNIFEPRYLNMVRDALGLGRMLGMIQPVALPEGAATPEDDITAVYTVGCAGRIVSFQETDDGRMLITLKGISRFRVAEELPLGDGYRRVRADYAPYAADLNDDDGAIDRDRLTELLKRYFERQRIEADWDAIETTPDERLVTTLAMICPFEPSEKQALLEAPDLSARGQVLTGLIEMALLDDIDGAPARH